MTDCAEPLPRAASYQMQVLRAGGVFATGPFFCGLSEEYRLKPLASLFV
jgi:hypothetical protein